MDEYDSERLSELACRVRHAEKLTASLMRGCSVRVRDFWVGRKLTVGFTGVITSTEDDSAWVTREVGDAVIVHISDIAEIL